ncbi:MAG: phosphoribosylglycinamide formyltransferase [Bacteroidales bacterium OttesenSCG-928-I14]|jgi:phosphoribosylglycinamide formyltransferase-1|nr:phosphoribosylglycinamide formyltransferase [Bacteroidales bacterium OttesenSCG-928-I14]
MKRIALLASGSGSNVENIINHLSKNKKIKFPLILSNKEEAYVHKRAIMLGIPSYTHTEREFENGKVLQLLKNNKINFIVLAGFLLKIPENILKVYHNRIINIHPSLLPKFGGKGMYGIHVHKAVMKNKETESGITIHYVNEHYDKGKIIFQAKCKIFSTDSLQEIEKKIHALEYKYFPKVIEKLVFKQKYC